MISIVLGTRPEIIKMAPVIRACQNAGTDYSVLHTGQHYSYDMDRIFFDELELPQPDFNLDVGSGSHAEQTGKIMMGTERVFLKDTPDMVLVQGDTNTVMAAALAAAKLHISVGHVEAGLRSFDRAMPEEINRIIADHVASYLFAPTTLSRDYLCNEGIDEKKIFVTGNTVVDAVFQNREIARKKPSAIHGGDLPQEGYFLVTAHRTENVDEKSHLAAIIASLIELHTTYDLPVIFPMHPRTQKMMREFGIASTGLTITQPVGYLEFLQLEANARLVFTDSGGVQEESCILNVPCVTLRENTERPETITAGANILAGTDVKRIAAAAEKMMNASRAWENPYGDGKAGERIVEICKKVVAETDQNPQKIV
jgi:UDP-N-acetylglucosamine 2-epimerase (non-hydrolysing)